MNRDPLGLLVPVVALALLAFVVADTLSALRSAGAFSPESRGSALAPPDPFAGLDRRLEANSAGPSPRDVRDPFSNAPAPTPVVPENPVRPRRTTTPPPPPPRPTLTAIVFDNDPRALLLWDGRQYTVRAGSLFDDFRVASITRDRVVLERGGETIVLNRPQGE